MLAASSRRAGAAEGTRVRGEWRGRGGGRAGGWRGIVPLRPSGPAGPAQRSRRPPAAAAAAQRGCQPVRTATRATALRRAHKHSQPNRTAHCRQRGGTGSAEGGGSRALSGRETGSPPRQQPDSCPLRRRYYRGGPSQAADLMARGSYARRMLSWQGRLRVRAGGRAGGGVGPGCARRSRWWRFPAAAPQSPEGAPPAAARAPHGRPGLLIRSAGLVRGGDRLGAKATREVLPAVSRGGAARNEVERCGKCQSGGL